MPHTILEYDGLDFNVTVTLMIIDPKKENNAGIGFDWPPFTMGQHEIMLQEGLLNVLGAKIGDSVSIPVDFSGVLGDNSLTQLLALLCFESNGDAFVDFSAKELVFMEDRIPLSDIGLGEGEKTLTMNYTIS